MAENSLIEWCDHTFNPWEGCQKVGPGCDHCYAEARNARFSGGEPVNFGPGAPRRRTSDANWRLPLKWNRQAEREGRRARVFCASLADVFDNQVPAEWRVELFELIQQTPHLDWLLLTKRIGNVGNMLPVPFDVERFYPNVWIGATICNQAEADRDIPKLLAVPAAKRFLSMEPLLGPVNLERACDIAEASVCAGTWGTMADPQRCALALRRGSVSLLDWVIVGGESGPKARPMHPQWARSLRDQCAEAGVPFLFKQWGEWAPLGRLIDAMHNTITREAEMEPLPCAPVKEVYCNDGTILRKVGKKAAGRLLDGREWGQFPAQAENAARANCRADTALTDILDLDGWAVLSKTRDEMLPAMPEPLIQHQAKFATVTGYTADQMREYAKAAVEAERATASKSQRQKIDYRAECWPESPHHKSPQDPPMNSSKEHDMGDLMQMAREAGIARWHKDLKKWVVEPGLETFAQLVAKKAAEAEREACAAIAAQGFNWALNGDEIADAIRARSAE